MKKDYFIKICGITNLEDAETSIAAGATAIGLNFYPKSKRYIEPVKARDIAEAVRGKAHIIGVFVNENINSVKSIASDVKLNYCQFHGEEDHLFVNQFGNAIKTFRVNESFKNAHFDDYKTKMFLLDTFSAKEYGGTGTTFNWLMAREANEFGNVIIAGGLNEQNVAEAISIAQPWGVDVSSGVEVVPGKKDPEKIKNFILKAKNAFDIYR